jgi:uncharacterized protein (DUF2062 family)
MWSEVKKIRSLKKGAQLLRREWQKEIRNFRGDNKDLALSVAVGVFVGFTPTVGFHTIILYLFSRVFKKSFLAAFIGSCFPSGTPWQIPLVYFLGYKFGVLLLGREAFGNVSLNYLKLLSGKQIIVLLGKPLLLGSFSLAALGGLVSYPIALIFFKKTRKEQT